MTVNIAPETNVIEGTPAFLSCKYDTNGVLYKHEWLKESRVIGTSSILQLERVQKEDSGRYFCRVSATIPNTVPARIVTWASSQYLYVKRKFVLLQELFKFQFLHKQKNSCRVSWMGMRLLAYHVNNLLFILLLLVFQKLVISIISLLMLLNNSFAYVDIYFFFRWWFLSTISRYSQHQ